MSRPNGPFSPPPAGFGVTPLRAHCRRASGNRVAVISEGRGAVSAPLLSSPQRGRNPGAPGWRGQFSGSTVWRCLPRPAMPSSTTSPGLSHFGSFMPRATPGGVPVGITSPG